MTAYNKYKEINYQVALPEDWLLWAAFDREIYQERYKLLLQKVDNHINKFKKELL